MKNYICGFLLFFLFAACQKKTTTQQKESAVAGSTTILVDETIFPIIEDVAILFENEYKGAKINLVSQSEKEILTMIRAEKGKIAILARTLDSTEVKYFNTTKKVFPRITEFGLDAIGFISNGASPDSTVVLNDVLNLLRGKPNSRVKGLVFDHPNSSCVHELMTLANVDELPKERIFALNSNAEVVKYVANNQGVVGVIGINWLLQPSQELVAYLPKVKVLALENVKNNENRTYIKPNQTNIADGSYPITRKLYMLNFQGTTGLGMGFASYLAGQQGQRIILKSGLVPKHFPTRQVAVRNKIE